MDIDTAIAVAQPFAPRMHREELAQFLKLLERAHRYLEFGMGGSTILASVHPLERIWCVESNREWVEKCKRHDRVLAALQDGRMAILHVDIGPIKGWGFPADQTLSGRWPAYYLAVWGAIAASTLDLVFVDGRWRVECILQALLRVGNDCMLALHDFGDKRVSYAAILPFVEVVDQTRTLLSFKRKPDIDWYALMEEIPRHARNPR